MTDDNKTTPPPAPGLDLDGRHRADMAEMRAWRDLARRERDEARAELARLTAELCAEQDKRSDVIRERNEAIEEARNATAVNRILKAEVPRLEAEVARLTADLAAARAEVNCGQDGPCVKAPGCARHWQERNRELADELAAARAVPGDVEALAKEAVDGALEAGRCSALGHAYLLTKDPAVTVPRLMTAIARAISDATAARGTVGGLLATNRCGVCAQPTDNKNHEPVGDGLPPEPTCDCCLADDRGPLPKGG